ncbi:undecaprenyl-diphosphate phosphatase [Paenibacillus sp. GSMTC-2017]|uniref:undecaprenyl-diphosphate phosphatase n=1 Tax=Paenibacillus sp. GSMTC-2017 TaxID=2794350 RepID=UPI0018D7B423|nr:undecaprenyl-diphosphate phosphatase [Paenibacillus sp. GSMTC-2017]MBH5316470.1 undecaprenyl-diphosphate phosphatase [Paenibacillus sp. GSMTC-2017]
MEDLIKAIIMGIVEGLTEFLPISSTGHMILTGELIGFTGDRADTFKVVIQLGAVLAVLVLYRTRFLKMLNFNFRKGSGLNALHVAIAMMPASVLAVALHSVIKKYLFGYETVLIGLVAGGILMIVADRSKRPIVAQELDDISYKQAFYIGCFQILSLWPGFSRSGSTISGGMLTGTSQKAAAEFTFIVSVPIMVGASAVDLIGSREFLTIADLPLFLVGLITAFIVGMIAVVTFINMMKKLRLSYFAYYRFALAALFFFIMM